VTSSAERLQNAIDRMHEPWAGVHALDFANTLEPRGGPPPLTLPEGYELRDELTTYDDLVGWAVHKATIDVATGSALISEADGDPDSRDTILSRALTLRDAIYRVFWQIAEDGTPSSADVNVIMDEYADATAHATLVVTASSVAWEWVVSDQSLARPLWPVARSAFELLTTGERNRIKVCPGPGRPPLPCGWLFYDTTKNGSRRWCSMSDCGAVTKARLQTDRRRAQRAASRS
jgi:predicted RNA-binding Zn ribbon-like protein